MPEPASVNASTCGRREARASFRWRQWNLLSGQASFWITRTGEEASRKPVGQVA
jgi:hypothetical protein